MGVFWRFGNDTLEVVLINGPKELGKPSNR